MSATSTRTGFNSAPLVRLLSGMELAGAAETKQSFAERLSAWLDLADAISLSAALKRVAAPESESSLGTPLGEDFARRRQAMIEAIGGDEVQTAGNARIKFPMLASGTAIEGARDFSPYHRYYLAHQRDMEAAAGALRAEVRSALAGAAAPLRQLGALDTVFDEALRVRERNLFGSLPLLLAKRFEQLHGAHLAALAESPHEDSLEHWIEPGGWLAAFCRDMQRALRAELDLRLQPIMGLIEALGNEVTRHQ